MNELLTRHVNKLFTDNVKYDFTFFVNIRQEINSMEKDKPNIFDYEDYRDFLGAYYRFKKQTGDYWSYGLWIRKLGLKSVSALTMIVKKQRHMGPNMIPKFLEFFQFEPNEEQHFLEMIRLNKASKGDPKLLVLLKNKQTQKGNQMSSIGGGPKGDFAPDRQLVFQWGTYAIREMGGLKDYQKDPQWISERLDNKLDTSTCEAYLGCLESEGIIDKQGSPTNKVIRPEGDFEKKEPQQYHQELMQLSSDAVDIPLDLRALHASTLTINSKKLKEAKELIREFQVRFSQLMEAVPGDEVYQLNMQFFPLTKKLDG